MGKDVGRILQAVGGLLLLQGLGSALVYWIWDRHFGVPALLQRHFDTPWWTSLILAVLGFVAVAFGEHLVRAESAPAEDSPL